MGINETIKQIQLSLKGRKLNLSNEKILQTDIQKIFEYSDIEFKREVKLGDLGIVDFMIDTLAVEIKIKNGTSAMNIYRQLERYSESSDIEGILLMTSKTMSLPGDINGKPVYVLSLGRSQI